MEAKIPKIKKAILTERITLPIDPQTRRELLKLKVENGVDISEWIRRLIRSNLDHLKSDLAVGS